MLQMQNNRDEPTASFKIEIIKKFESMLRHTIIRANFFDGIPRLRVRLPRSGRGQPRSELIFLLF
jgi:hypothetical protein